MDTHTLEIHIAHRVAVVWMAREKVRNAFNETMIAELRGSFERLGADPGVRAIVLAARGPAFCAGADLDWMRRMSAYSPEENRHDARQLAEMLRTISPSRMSFSAPPRPRIMNQTWTILTFPSSVKAWVFSSGKRQRTMWSAPGMCSWTTVSEPWQTCIPARNA